MSRIYTASKTRAQGRPGWVITFRHPLRNDSQGKPGLKMRRGLGTADPVEADKLIGDMNVLLSDPSWWNAIRRAEAEQLFSPIVVGAFFDEIQAGRPRPSAIREAEITLPGRAEGYARVLFVGTTGAGKTTLLRHLIGSDHERDRFPSTSTAKTTVSDIEIVLVPGSFGAVVTFMSEHVALANIEECIATACVAAFEGKRDEDIADRLLNHRDQRFRLGYALGTLGGSAVEEDDFAFEDEIERDADERSGGEDESVPADEVAGNRERLRSYVGRIRVLAESVSRTLSVDLGEDIKRLSGSDLDAAEELFEAAVWESEDFSTLAQDVLDDLLSRFDLLPVGELVRRRSGWPESWRFQSDDRDGFIRAVRWFASNYAPQFGRLLTPLVDGIRVRGPLFPTFTDEQPKLVLLDGQGLGHTPESSSSVTTQVTGRFPEADVILLVDSAQQPMQAAPLSVLRAVATSGHQQKLAIAFTHFDNVKGSNLPGFAAKRAHVMASVANGLVNLRDALGGSAVVRIMEQGIDTRCYMLGGLDRRSKELPKGFQGELMRLLGYFEQSILPPPAPPAFPRYNPDGLPLAVLAATRSFERPWLGRLGLGGHDSVPKEHWTRIKALNRRIAGELDIEYDSLRPVADLVAKLTEEVSRFLDSPAGWDPVVPTEEEGEAALDQIRQAVHAEFHSLAVHRLVQDQLDDWRRAFLLRGAGSTFSRAQQIRGILEEAAPVPDAIMADPSAKFLSEVRHIVLGAVDEYRSANQASAS